MKEKRFKLTEFAVENKTTIYILTIILIVAGVMAYQSTPKEKFPEVVFPYYSIVTVYPGTSPTDMENLVTRPIEKELKGINGIKKLSSNSLQDASAIFIEFETNVDDQRAYTDVKEAVDKAKSDLPDDILDDPEVTRIDLSEIPILNINLSGDLGLVQLKAYAEELQDRIEGLSEVTRVDIVGALDREIQINVDLYKMQAAGLTFNQIQSAVSAENMTISAGQIETDGMKRTMRIAGEFKQVDELKNIVIKDGVFLQDIAEIKDGFADRESYSRLFSQDVITLNVIKKSGENLIIAIDKINELLADFQKTAPTSLKISTTGDQSTMTRNNVSDLFNTIILGFFVVVLVLMFFMGVDNALFVAVAIPLSMLIAFVFIPVVGFTMNMVVLMAFILVLGIVVDNSIVVVENIYRHFTTTANLPIKPATKRAVAEVAIPVFAGTLTTMAPFVPLAFWQGIMGKFMFYLPITLIITLSASMFVAYVMNPVFAVSFMKYRGDRETTVNKRVILIATLVIVPLVVILYLTGLMWLGNVLAFGFLAFLLVKFVLAGLIKRFQEGMLPRLMNGYRRTLRFLLTGRRAYLVLFGTFLLLILTFMLMGVRTPKIILFPEGDPNNIYVYIKMPEGTAIEATDSIAKVVENRVFDIVGRDNPDVESIITNVASNAGENIFERTTQPKLAKITVTFVEYKFRTGPSTSTYLEALRENMTGIPAAEIAVGKENMGPPTGKPINIEISGEDLEEMIAVRDRLQEFIEAQNVAGIEELKTDMEANKPEIVVNIDREKASKMGINTAYVGMLLRTALYGTEISKFREGDDEYPIQLRLSERYRENIDALMDMKIVLPGQRGVRQIPISAIASFEYVTTYGGIIREDHERVITLYSNVLSGYNANEIVQTLKKSLPNFDRPNNISINFTGEQEDAEESMAFLSTALLVAIALIFLILVLQFNSMSKPVIILTQVVFSFIGVLLGFVIFNIEMSIIMTGMGIIAVAGIVVKNAIILIDYTDILLRENNKSTVEAIIQAGATRLTPVLLTAASTIFGLLPLAIGLNINFTTLFTELDPNIYFGGDSAAFWNPLAWTIIFGLAFATFLTLVVVPAMYLILCKGKSRMQKVKAKVQNGTAPHANNGAC